VAYQRVVGDGGRAVTVTFLPVCFFRITKGESKSSAGGEQAMVTVSSGSELSCIGGCEAASCRPGDW
jgi:hypothetical protein